MSINLSIPSKRDFMEMKPRITVIGVGGAGGNAVNNMIVMELEGVNFIAANTDSQALAQSRADHRIQMGNGTTRGLGAGAHPEIGRLAAEDALDELLEKINGSNMVFIAAGMGGGTGTGAAPVIARTAKENGILTVGVVTKPFHFEGAHRMNVAETGVDELAKVVDTLIVIPNQNLFRVANEKTTFADAFKMADNVLYSGVRGVTDLMVMPGMINLDFADIRAVMGGMGKAMMGTGEAAGERRALDAAEAAISNPLLDDISMRGAKGLLINITGGKDMTLFEVDEAANRIREEVDINAFINFGSTLDESMEGKIRVSVVATGMDANAMSRAAPTMLSLHMDKSGETDAGLNAAPRAAAAVSAEIKPAAAPEAESASIPMAIPMAIPTVISMPVQNSPDDKANHCEDESEQESTGLDQTNVEAMIKIEPRIWVANEKKVAPQEAIEAAPEAKPEARADEKPLIVANHGTIPAATPVIGAAEAFMPKTPVINLDNRQVAPSYSFAAVPANAAIKAEAEAKEKSEKVKGPSLFERVTGSGRAAKSSLSAKVSSFGQKKKEPTFASNAVKEEAKPKNDQQPVDGQAQNERMATTRPEEDLLDIPAFLRRQAN